MERSHLDHLRLVVSNDDEMGPKRTAQNTAENEPATPAPAKKRQTEKFNVWLPNETKKRIDSALAQIKKRIGFPPNYTDCVQHLLDDALKKLEEEREEAARPEIPKDRRF